MDFPSQYPDSPARPLAGPARSRLVARQARTSSLKPYYRGSTGIAANLQPEPARDPTASSSKHTDSLSPQSFSLERAASSSSQRKPTSSGLFGSIGRAITKPLSWLSSSTGVAKSDLADLPMPFSSSTDSLTSLARRGASRLIASNGNNRDSLDEDGNDVSLAARAVGARLAAGVLRGSSSVRDIESHDSSNVESPIPPLRRSVRNAATNTLSPPPPVASSSRKRLTSSTSMSALTTVSSRRNTRSSTRALDLGSTAAEKGDEMEIVTSRSPSPALSNASAAIRSHGRQRLSLGPNTFQGVSHQTGASNLVSPALRRSSSLRPESEANQLPPSQSTPSFVFGFGTEKRFSGAPFGSPQAPPSASPFNLPSRSPLAPRGSRLSFRGHGGSDHGLTPSSPNRLRGSSLQPSASVGPGSRVSSRLGASQDGRSTPRRRQWNTLNLTPRGKASEGEELMREHSKLGQDLDGRMGSPHQSSASLLGKRDADMSVDMDEDRMSSISQSARKRQMVWDSELGFISREELRAREPAPPVPKNEAERILNVLESMRTPLGDARRENNVRTMTPSRHMNTVPVPLPVADRSGASSSMSGPSPKKSTQTSMAASVAPYSRALRKSKLSQSHLPVDEQSGMRARLRRSRQAVPAEANEGEEMDFVTDEDIELTKVGRKDKGMRVSKRGSTKEKRLQQRTYEEDDVEEDVAFKAEEQEQEQEKDVEEGPRPRTRGAVTRSMATKTSKENVTSRQSTKVPDAKKGEGQAAGEKEKQGPLDSSRQVVEQHTKPAAPTSQRISLSAARPASQKKDKFSVRSDSDASQPRERSSLRQGAAKTTRTHASSGRISAWEEDLEEDEDLPDADELSKIKLPTNLFPSGFSFGGSNTSASSSTGSTPVPPNKPVIASAAPSFTFKPAETEAPKSNGVGPNPSAAAKPITSGSSLLSRLGDKVPGSEKGPEASSTTPSKPLAPPPATGAFSFVAPTRENPKTTFSFAAPPKPAEGSASAEASPAAKPSTPSSDFFSAPPSGTSTPKLDNEKKSGPVPNFFGSSLSKSSETEKRKQDDQEAKSGSSTPSFSFSKPSDKPLGGFGEKEKPLAAAEAPKPLVATSNPFGGLNGATAPFTTATPAATKPFTFGEANKTSVPQSASVPASPFSVSFGGGPSSKRPADDEGTSEKKVDEEQPAKKAVFSFGPVGGQSEKKEIKPPAVTAPSTAGSFGGFGTQPSGPKPDGKAAAPAKVPNFFGAPSASSNASSSNPSPAATFSFGKPASTTKEASTASQQPSEATTSASKPTFTFGATSTTPSNPIASQDSKPKTGNIFTGFGATSTAATPAAATSVRPATFGSSSEMMEDSPFTNGGAAPTASKFTFGTPSASAATTTGSGPKVTATAPFTFGTPSTTPPTQSGTSTPRFGSPAPASSSGPSATNMFGQPSASSQAQGTTASTASAGSSPAPMFTFGSPAPLFGGASAGGSTASVGGSTGFGAGSAATGLTTTAAAAAPPSSGAAFTFGASSTSSGTSGPKPGGGFTFGTPSTTLPQQASSQPNQGAPQTPAPTFSFGSGANTPTNAGGMFQFGATNGGGGGGSAPFVFGASGTPAAGGPTNSITNSTSSPAAPMFGASAGANAPPQPSSPFAFNANMPTVSFGGPPQHAAPATPTPPGSAGSGATPGGSGMFSIGSAPSSTPGGRTIKPLRGRRRN
ncbi:hypothetical protein IE53DRAFT_365862 [Violaceomyces palustris]|uniref:Uncharacterized protein n=1 Tax=Violaceomyces palustris TaxID=1673888 RepID=A0ACD0P7P8_9BASI|nr:hypothetical protein IE53DRAFT_365862 [Violaceomyces palustris]